MDLIMLTLTRLDFAMTIEEKVNVFVLGIMME